MASLPVITIPKYLPGTEVVYEGMVYAIAHITISKNVLYLRLEGFSTDILADSVTCPDMVVDFNLMRSTYDQKLLAAL